MDGINGKIILNATPEISQFYVRQQQIQSQLQSEFDQFRSLPSISADGLHVEIAGTLGNQKMSI